jgi:hypothetical protein
MVESEVYGKPEFCVTPGGTVLRYEIKELNDSIVYEAQSVTVGAPDASVFEVPQGYATNDKALSNPGSRSVTFGRPGGTSSNAP